MKNDNNFRQVRVAPVIPVAKAYKPKFEITNVYVESVVEEDQTVWFLNLCNYDGQVFKYTLLFSEPE